MANGVPSRRGRLLRLALPLALVFIGIPLAYHLFWQRRRPLVVYCAHDAVYAEKILRQFERRAGIRVAIRFDTEATKSLGLVEQIIREKDRPRCDVFWNNEPLGTMELKARGLLTPYKGPGFERIPAAFKDPEGYWTGFAARFRVYIERLPEAHRPGYVHPRPHVHTPELGEHVGSTAIAKPLYGTTLTHYCILWQAWGPETLKAWHADCRRNGIREVGGNAQVKDAVVQGTCKAGYTDTDDFFVALDEGKPVAMSVLALEDGATFCIPNTVCIIQGTRHMSEAQKLADYLLSAECESALARSESRQVPLGPVEEERVPERVRELRPYVLMGYPLGGLEKARTECLAWLKSEYLR